MNVQNLNNLIHFQKCNQNCIYLLIYLFIDLFILFYLLIDWLHNRYCVIFLKNDVLIHSIICIIITLRSTLYCTIVIYFCPDFFVLKLHLILVGCSGDLICGSFMKWNGEMNCQSSSGVEVHKYMWKFFFFTLYMKCMIYVHIFILSTLLKL